jgi:hypothetical protein
LTVTGRLLVALTAFLLVDVVCTAEPGASIPRYRYFAEALRLGGGSGKIYSMNTHTLETGQLSIGVHRFDVTINYGATPNAEAGIHFSLYDMQDFSVPAQNISAITPYVKYHLIASRRGEPLDLSVGIHRASAVIMLEKSMPRLLAASVGCSLFFSLAEREKFVATVTASRYGRWLEFIVDADVTRARFAAGVRALLTPEIKLDLFLVDLTRVTDLLFTNFMFGVTARL